MNNEFKKLQSNNETRYVLESGTGGGTDSGAVANNPSAGFKNGVVQRRVPGQVVTQEAEKEKLSQKPRQGPLRRQTGGGKHTDQTKVIPRKQKYPEKFEETKRMSPGEKLTRAVNRQREKGAPDEKFDRLQAQLQGIQNRMKPKEPDIVKNNVDENTGDKPFDKMMKGVTSKTAVTRQQKADRRTEKADNQARAKKAFGNMFGGDDPTGNLKIGEQGMAEDDVEDFFAAGGKVTQVKPQRGPRRPGSTFSSKHIGTVGGTSKSKGTLSGMGANTGKAAKPVVAVEDDEYNEYSDEVDMVKNNLHTIVRACKDLADSLIADENLPEWVEEKISMAKQNMVTVAEYIQSQHEQGHIYKNTEEDYGMNGYETATASPIQPGAGRDDSVHENDAYFNRLGINLKSAMGERSVSQAQHNLMVGVAHNPEFAKKMKVKQKVGQEFARADVGRDINKLPKHVIPKKKK